MFMKDNIKNNNKIINKLLKNFNYRLIVYFIVIVASFVAFLIDKYIIKFYILTAGNAFNISILFAIVSASFEIVTRIENSHYDMDEKHNKILEKINCPINIKSEAIVGEINVECKLLEIVNSLSIHDEVFVTARSYEEELDKYYDVLKNKIKFNDIKLSRIIFLSRDETDSTKYRERLDKLNKWLKEEHSWRKTEKKLDRYDMYCTILPYFYNCIYVRSPENKNSIAMIGINDKIPYYSRCRSALYLEGRYQDLWETFGTQFEVYKKESAKYDGSKDVKTILDELKKNLV